MKVKRLYQLMVAWWVLTMLSIFPAMAQQNPDTPGAEKVAIRYVSKSGSSSGDGKSWGTARSDLQATINELYEFIQGSTNYDVGHIYVAEGTYVPTESTQETATGTLYATFKIKPGIEIYGGFQGIERETSPADRPKVANGKDWQFTHKTILSGSLLKDGVLPDDAFVWQENMNSYKIKLPRNSYHVVWFATEDKGGNVNGLNKDGRGITLSRRALIDGCTIQGGSSTESQISPRRHNSFGGGVYMVGNSVLRNCVVTQCYATLAGGGIYMDGGGLVESCYVHTNQCDGVGLNGGYGGGICMVDSGLVTRSLVVDNMARIGGGMAMVHEEVGDHPGQQPINRFAITASSSIITNNTSSTEAGGLLMMRGGTINQMTIVNNRCAGAEMIIRNRRYGLSGGVYIEECGTVFNSILYGNEVGMSNLQYAAHISDTPIPTLTEQEKPFLRYVGVQQLEQTDWTGTQRHDALALYDDAANAANPALIIPNFLRVPNDGVNPLVGVQAGGTYSNAVLEASKGSALTPEEKNERYDFYWRLKAFSPLRTSGVRVESFSNDKNMLFAKVDQDFRGTTFAAKTALGAYVPDGFTFAAAKCADYAGGDNIYTLFVNPALKMGPDDAAKSSWGGSWDAPFLYLEDALQFIRDARSAGTIQVVEGTGVKIETADLSTAKFQIFVKEGTMTTGSNYFTGNLHQSHIGMESHVSIYGGFSKTLKGTAVTQRNVVETPTILTGNVMSLQQGRCADQVVVFNGVSNAVLDGFYIERGYALPDIKEGNIVYQPKWTKGAGILIHNEKPQATDMTGIVVRNCKVSNCMAEDGAAVSIHSAGAKSTVGVQFENCIFHNNSSVGKAENDPSVILLSAAQDATLNVGINHCNILKNVGNPVKTTKTGTVNLTLTNSIVWANAAKEMLNSETLQVNTAFLKKFTAKGTVNSCLFDKGTKITGTAGQAILEYQRNLENFPSFVNSTKNIGAVFGADQTYYGSSVDFTPNNLNPIVNAANDDVSDGKTGGTDMTSVTTRDYGGAADVGAIENTHLPKNGTVIYVRDYDGDATTPGGDGSSWAKAINGNSTDVKYKNNHGFQGVDAELYAENTQLTGLQWAVDEAFYRSLKKTDGKIKYETKYQLNYKKGKDTFTATIYNKPGANQGDRYESGSLTLSDVDTTRLVQVWVGAGEYTRSEGFFMRNSVNVYGGFPKDGNPGMDERNPRDPKKETIIQTNTNDIENWGPIVGDALNKAANPRDLTDCTVGDDMGKLEKYPGKFQDAFNAVGYSGNLNRFNQEFKIHIKFPQLTRVDGMKADATGDTNISFKITGLNANNQWEDLHDSGNNSFDKADFSGEYQALCFIAFNSWGRSRFTIKNLSVLINGIYYDLNNYTKACQSHRVLTQPYPYYAGDGINTNPGQGNMEYDNIPLNPFDTITVWDGFVIQNGRTQIAHQRDGGAGVALRHKGKIINCVVRNNINQAPDYNQRGGGIFCNGGEIVNCLVENNHGNVKSTEANRWSFGGGLYLRLGTVYNTCFAKNSISSQNGVMNNNYSGGSGVFFENGIFYNNTITKNTGRYALETGDYFRAGSIEIYNTILYGNTNNSGKDVRANTQLAKMSFCLLASDQSYEASGAAVSDMKYGDPLFVNAGEGDYSLQSTSAAINAGTEDLGKDENGDDIKLPSFDAAYHGRIQDCRVDIGAFEYNGAKDILPTIYDGQGKVVGAKPGDTHTKSLVGDKERIVYFVSQTGKETGNMSADYNNPACKEKLQLVLDAAGRKRQELITSDASYKNYEIVVRLAGDANSVTGFSYMPTRSTNSKSGNPRDFSFIIPHGITVEGGWNEDFNDRNVTNNPTRLSGIYQAKGNDVAVYHVVTFTNDVYDSDQNVTGQTLEEVTQRTILDGLFLEKGQATGEVMKHQKGGVAIVPAYGHIRNCILEDNHATLAGGALHLQPRALVSGCLFQKNHAQNGGAVSVALEGENLEKEEKGNENAVVAPAGMAHIYTSTLVENTAEGSGGALWFGNNVRANSCVFWANKAGANMNVAGTINPKASTVQPTNTLDFYPLSYCAVEHRRVPGLNNIKVHPDNERDVRFVDLKDDAFYGLSRYSRLGRAGMSVAAYNQLVADKGLAETDFMDISRGDVAKQPEDQVKENKANEFIEIGARAFNGQLLPISYTESELLTRLYVAPMNVDWSIARKLETSGDPIYSQEGSSFALPMKTLDAALSYIRHVRERGVKNANDEFIDIHKQRFEVIMAAGYYYPTEYKEVSAEHNAAQASFHVPYGVSIIGGMNNRWQNNTVYEGQVGKEYTSQTNIGITIQFDAKYIKAAEMMKLRPKSDQNANGIIEPWELQQQTILSGEVVANGARARHIVTCLPYPLQGEGTKENIDPKALGDRQLEKNVLSAYNGTRPVFVRPGILFDGIEFEMGDASGDATNSPYANRGSAIVVAGNMEYQQQKDKTYIWNWAGPVQSGEADVTAVGKYNIPLTLSCCRFNGNEAREGGAVFTDGELFVYSSSFERNWAKGKDGVEGKGGAIASNYETTFVNTIFENNQAGADGSQGRGGAFYAGKQAWSHVLNCTVVMNLADNYPAFYFGTPNYKKTGTPTSGTGIIDADAQGADRHLVVNTVFWGNEVKGSGVPFVVNYADKLGKDLTTMQAISAPECNEALWFCGYEIGKGRRPNITLVEGVDIRKTSFKLNATHYMPNIFKNYLEPLSGGGENPLHINLSQEEKDAIAKLSSEQKEDIMASNYNVYVDSNNDLLNGPNFSNPSDTPGVEGYDASSSWLVTRPNSLTDNGWSYLMQEATVNPKSGMYEIVFKRNPDNPNVYVGGGIYTGLYEENWKAFEKNGFGGYMALGDDKYMSDLHGNEIRRICMDPDPKAGAGFIDIGVYEYRKISLKPATYDEVDVLWVCQTENPALECTGETAEQATSNVQQAIETLLSSRNGHHKEVRFLEGVYAPKFTMSTQSKNNLGFFFNTKSQDLSAWVNPKIDSDIEGLGVASFAFRGGWSVQGDYRDLVSLKSHIVSVRPPVDDSQNTSPGSSGYEESSNAKNAKHLFFIEDALQRKSYYSDYKIHSLATGDVVPIIFDGLVITNDFASDAEGNAIYYAPQYQDDNQGHESTSLAIAPSVTGYVGIPKLAITRCEFSGNGIKHKFVGETIENAVVTISEGGGKAIVYNSLFHSNQGSPLHSTRTATDAANVTDVVNSTFALNQYALNLNANSHVYNSVLWRNHPQAGDTFGAQLKLDGGTVATDFTSDKLQYNALMGMDVTIPEAQAATYHYNVGLSADNVDLIYGPNFTKPLETEDNTNEQTIRQRDFSILPSIRLLNSGSKELYGQTLFNHCQFGAEQRNKPSYSAVQNDMETNMATPVQPGDSVRAAYTDIEKEARLVATKIDRGAYEYLSKLYRVVYVNPARTNPGFGTGWNSPYNADQVQNAIDMAAVYAHNVYQKPEEATGSVLEDNAHAYVLIKGDDQKVLKPMIMRAGVSVYGSIDNAFYNEISEEDAADNVKLNAFIDEMRYSRPGMVQPRVQRTVVGGVSATNDCRGHRALIDGVEVKGDPEQGKTLQEITSPVVDLYLTFGDSEAEKALKNNTQLVMRNSIVNGFYNTSVVPTNVNAPTTAAVVRADNALLYNVLTFNNQVNYTSGASAGVGTVQLGANGYLENCTIVASDFAEEAPAVPAFWMPGTSATTHVHNSYIYPGNIMEIVGPDGNTHVESRPRTNTFCTYFDTPDYLNAFGEEPYLPYFRYQLQETSGEINAGNSDFKNLPEKYHSFISHENDRDLLGNPRMLGKNVDNGCYETWKVDQAVELSNVSATPGAQQHYYPHEGSVVYLYAPMSVAARFKSASVNEIRPGYFLLHAQPATDAGWYSQGRLDLQLRYAAVELALESKNTDNLVALPFAYDYTKGSEVWTTEGDKQVLKPHSASGVCRYNGQQRAGSSYLFSNIDSKCWNTVEHPVEANQGVLYPVLTKGIHRFTALGTAQNDYVYSEKANQPKQVTLQQYNLRDLKGNKPAFTAVENMGWNLVGMPYMVSRYATAAATQDLEDYQMNVPHVVYVLNEQGAYDTKQSWEAGTVLKAGAAFFTQTAVIGQEGKEQVSFALPAYTSAQSVSDSKSVVLRSEAGEDHLTVCPSAEATDLQYSLNVDGLKWMAPNEELPQLYLANEGGTRFSLVAAAPVATELKLGVYAPKEGTYTFGLPNDADFGDFTHVWLTDRERGIVTDLKEEEYAVALTAALDTPERFTLKFGGAAPVIDNAAARGQYEVFIRNGQLYVRGLEGGEHIRVYDVAGRDVLSAQASGGVFSTRLSTGVYIVKVNGNVYKVR